MTGNFLYFDGYQERVQKRFGWDMETPAFFKISRYCMAQALVHLRDAARNNFKAVVKPAKKTYKGHRPNSYNEMVEGIRIALSNDKQDVTGYIKATDSHNDALYDAYKLKFFENGTQERYWETDTTTSTGEAFKRSDKRLAKNKFIKKGRNSNFVHRKTQTKHRTGKMPQMVFFQPVLQAEEGRAMSIFENTLFRILEEQRNA